MSDMHDFFSGGKFIECGTSRLGRRPHELFVFVRWGNYWRFCVGVGLSLGWTLTVSYNVASLRSFRQAGE